MKSFWVSLLIFGLTLGPRLYRLDNPVADWHSWRQADTAAVARNFVKGNFNLLYPQSDSLLALNPKQLPNPDRLFINEFPFYNAIVAVIYRIFGINEAYARLVSAVFASVGGVCLYLIASRLFSQKVAWLTAGFYAFNPYNVYYGRVIMPDPIFVSLSLMSLALFLRRPWGLLSSLVMALAILVKPYALFMLPAMVYYGRKDWRRSWLWGLLVLLPFILWRVHYQRHPEANFDTTWLFNQFNIRFSGAFFRWLIFDRLNRLIFATGGFVLLILGMLNSYGDKNRLGIFIWLFSVAAYMTIFAMGNVTHDYYQLPVVPVGSILVAFGFWHLIDTGRKFWGKIINTLAAMALLAISLAFGWYEVRGFYNINHPEIVAAGKAVDKLTPPDALVIAAYNSDPAFLYQTNRYGWPDGVNLEDKAALGATHYVSVNQDNVSQYLEARCPVVEKTSEYILVSIKDCL